MADRMVANTYQRMRATQHSPNIPQPLARRSPAWQCRPEGHLRHVCNDTYRGEKGGKPRQTSCSCEALAKRPTIPLEFSPRRALSDQLASRLRDWNEGAMGAPPLATAGPTS